MEIIRMEIKYSATTLLVGLLLIISISSSTGQFYNTRCVNNDQCNGHQFLSCHQGYCQCDSRSQVFDHGLQNCVIRPGGKCFFEGGASENGFLKCSKNSVCVSSVCTCQPGYAIPPNGEVLCKPNFDNKCKHSGDCDSTKGLDCIHGGCQCTNSSLSYQGMFGCVESSNPEFVKMMATLKQTEKLLKENHIDINTVVDEFRLDASNVVEHRAQPRQLFNSDANPFGTIDSAVDLFTSPQTQGGGLFSAFNSLFGSMRQAQGYGVPGLGAGNQGGYSGSGGTPGTTGGYSSGPVQNDTPRANFPLITNLLNNFNRIIPFIRRLSQLFNPLRFIQRLLTNFRTLFPGLGAGLRNPGLGQGGYSSGGSGAPSSSYGPPGSGTGGGIRTPSTAYGPPTPAAQSIQNFNQITPIQQPQQQGQQSTFTNYQTQTSPSLTNNFETLQAATSSYLPQNKRQVPGPGFQNQIQPNNHQNFQNQNQPNNHQNFQNQNQPNNHQNFQNQIQPNNQQNFNQNQNQNIKDETVNDPPLIVLPSTLSNNQYPRQERFSNNHFDGDSSPYLPEHL